MPLATSYEAAGEFDRLRRLLIDGTRIALIVALPIQVALFFRGGTFLNLWMGQQYGPTSGRVVQILLLGQVFTLANATSMNIVFGLAKHKRFAIWLAIEAVANITLSIFLARRIGIYGVAIGTVIPTLFVQIVLWPRYICQVVDVPLWLYVFQAWVRPALATIPYGVVCYVTERYWLPTKLIGFFSQIIAILPVYLVFVVFSFRKEIAQQLKMRTKRISPLPSDPEVELSSTKQFIAEASSSDSRFPSERKPWV